MMLSTALWAAVGTLAIGTAALWSNWRRAINRTLAALAGYVTVWLVCLHGFVLRPEQIGWLKAAWIAAGFFPLALWTVRDVVLDPSRSAKERARNLKFWWVYPFAVVCIVCSPAFLEAGRAGPVYLWGYYTVVLGGVAAHLWLGITTIWKLRGQTGARRLELQLVILGGVLSGVTAHGLLGLGAALHEPAWDRLMPLALTVIVGGLTWSLLTTRLLDAKHILTIGIEKLALVAGVSTFVWGTEQIAVQFIPEWMSLGIAIALGLWFAAVVRPWLQEVSQRKAAAERVRNAAFDIARKDLRAEEMEKAFLQLLCDWGHCERAVIFIASPGRLVGGGLEWAANLPELKLVHTLRWATPERLERERPRAHGAALARLLEEHGFGALVTSGGPSLGCAIALSKPRTCRPYTYTEVGQLIGLEAIIESALSRAQYLAKAQHAEQLATVGLLGASIAHEIRNPLVSIKTFVQLLPNHYTDAAFREKFFRLIGDEVSRIDRLTEQLLDLSSPRVFSSQEVAIHLLLSGCIDLVGSKADDKGVKLISQFHAQKETVYTDPNAVKQVVLNLSFNAIQALEQQPGERWVTFSTREVAAGVEVTVRDNGPGIAPEVWSRLFQPFQSTKSSGFGLGLAICKDILSSLHASITADPPEPGCGATFRIILPCQPPTS